MTDTPIYTVFWVERDEDDERVEDVNAITRAGSEQEAMAKTEKLTGFKPIAAMIFDGEAFEVCEFDDDELAAMDRDGYYEYDRGT